MLLRRLIKEGQVVVDVGAHIGYYTVLLARMVGKGRVFAFEPEPSNFSLLAKNVEINGCKNVVLVKKLFQIKLVKLDYTFLK